MKLFITAALAMAGSVLGQDYNYKQRGADWASANWGNNNCGGSNQSPIDLSIKESHVSKYLFAAEDQFNAIFVNPDKRRVEWDGRATKVKFDSNNDGSYFQSWHAYEQFKTANMFEGKEMFLRSPSEHTKEGRNMDLEIQIYHDKAYNRQDLTDNYKGGALSVLFDRTYKNTDTDMDIAPWMVELIDSFFDSMQLDKNDNPEIKDLQLNGIMQLINFQTRWMYTGTKTFPPCEGPYLWNVAQFVYPLKEKHYNLIKGQLQRSNDESIKENGNNRQVQTLDSKHQLMLTYDNVLAMLWSGLQLVVALLIFFVIVCMVCTGCCCFYRHKAKKAMSAIPTDGIQLVNASTVSQTEPNNKANIN